MNEKNPEECPHCGAPLPRNAPEGLCPRCVMAMNLALPTEQFGPEGTRALPASLKPPPSAAELSSHFPQFEILELLGRGGMGMVYKARQPKLDRWVALKIMPRNDSPDPAFAERFQREAKALARLSHPNIVGIHDFGQSGDYYFLLMEFVEGANLRQLAKAHPLSPKEALSIIPKICEALQYAHEEGVVHRDIKPENIMLDKKGRVKIADFGIAKILGKSLEMTLTGPQHTLGTPHYMAPEQLENPDSVDHRADIFSLGVVFYEMLTGQLPVGHFEAPSRKAQVDVRLDEVVLKTLAREPERRYQKASQVKTDIESITNPGTHPPRQVSQAPVTRPEYSDAQDRATRPEPLPRQPGIFGVLHKAWLDWWGERAKWFAIAVQSLLALSHVACLFCFWAMTSTNQWEEDGRRHFTYHLGLGDPWFSYETWPEEDVPFRNKIDFFSGSMWFVVAGFTLLYGIWRIERTLHAKAGFWRSPAPVALLWILGTLGGVFVGISMGQSALKEPRPAPAQTNQTVTTPLNTPNQD